MAAAASDGDIDRENYHQQQQQQVSTTTTANSTFRRPSLVAQFYKPFSESTADSRSREAQLEKELCAIERETSMINAEFDWRCREAQAGFLSFAENLMAAHNALQTVARSSSTEDHLSAAAMYRQMASSIESQYRIASEVREMSDAMTRQLMEHANALQKNHASYQRNRDAWLDTLHQLRGVSDAVDAAEVQSVFSSMQQ